MTGRPASFGHLAWPFFTDAHRAFALELEAWAPIGSHHSSPMNRTTWTPRSPRSCVDSARVAGCVTSCPSRTAWHRSASMCARSASRARCLGSSRAWPTSRSACRDWGPAPSRSSGATSSRSDTCRALPPATRSPRSRSRSRAPEAMSPPCKRPRAATAASWCSTAARRGSRMRGIADFYVVFARLRGRRAELRRGSSSTRTTPGSTVSERIT